MRTVLCTPLALVLAVFVSACGSAPTTDSLPSSDDVVGAVAVDDAAAMDPSDTDAAFARYEACMLDFGIDVSALNGIGPGINDQSSGGEDPLRSGGSLDEAMDACDDLLQAALASFDIMSADEEAELADILLVIQRCMGDRGFAYDATTDSFVVDGNQAGYEAALDECYAVALPDG